MRLAHVSDTHFGTEDSAVCAALGADLIEQSPDLVVLTGDITQRARRAQFAAARAFFDALPAFPLLALPGNHDLPLFDLVTRLLMPYRRFRRYFGPELAGAWACPEVAVIGVNSTRVWRHVQGTLSRRVIDRVATRLAELPQPFKVVALHHPLVAVAPDDRTNLVRCSELAVRRWSLAGADLILGGHIHLPYCLAVGSPRRRAVVLQAGTAVSRRRRGGLANSYNLVTFDPGRRRMAIERRDYQASGGFVRQSLIHATGGEQGWTLDGPR